MKKLGFWGGLAATALVSAWLAGVLTGSAHDAIATFLPLSRGFLPSTGQLFVMALALLLTVVATRNSIETYRHAALRRSARVCVIWAVGAVLIWLAMQFFAGALHGLDTVFPLLAGAVLATGLVCLRLVLPGTSQAVYVVTALVPFTLIVLLQGSLAARFDDLARNLAANSLEGLLASSLVQPLTFAVACAASALALRGRIMPGADIGVLLVNLVAWVLAAHLAWIVLLFVFGVADVPRWLPILTALVMALTGIVAAAVRLARTPDGLLAGVPGGDQGTAEVALVTSPPGDHRAWLIAGDTTAARAVKHGRALAAQGWNVVFCSAGSAPQAASGWTCIRLAPPTHIPNRIRMIASLAEAVGLFFARSGGERLAGWGARLARICRLDSAHQDRELQRLAAKHRELRPDLVIAFDLDGARGAHNLAHSIGAAFAIDLVDEPASQFDHDSEWARDEKPVIARIQKHYLSRADLVIASSEGLAEALAGDAPLKGAPIVIRDLPPNQPQEFRAVGERIKVLYQGDLSRPRELAAAIESVKLWRPEFELILRGEGDPAHIADLKRHAARMNVADRVSFQPARPADPVAAMASADVGFFSYGLSAARRRFLLPAELFGYVMAGLAVCVSSLDEVGKIVMAGDIGKLIQGGAPQDIAVAVNALNRENIEAYKRASLRASAKLNWDVESMRLVDACRQTVSRHRS
ncbi:hypothetical protein ABE438_15020 [Bosea sp. TWI1241]|uniref:hypothetical protein n=1 Tax=Bosea sp. TWI1241 TaxID=3148904 RepID=UPI003208B651